MTLHSRLRLVTVATVFTFLFVLFLNGLVNQYRMLSLNQFSIELDSNTALYELEGCVHDINRQMALLGANLSPDLVLQLELKKSLNQSLSDCEIKSSAPALSEEYFSEFNAMVSELLTVWSALVYDLEHDYVSAIQHQVQSQQQAQSLLNTELPTVQKQQRLRIHEAQQYYIRTSKNGSYALWGGIIVASTICGLLIFGVLGRLSAGITVLKEGAAAFARGDLQRRLDIAGSDEFSTVADEMNQMASRLLEARAQLETHTLKLEANLETIQQTQTELIRQERMAALGSLVAGVAHEVNTPLGVAFTAGTFCHDTFQRLQEEIQDGPVTPLRLTETMVDGSEALELMIVNLGKASQLIQAFKQVAVDRAQSDSRSVTMSTWLEQVMLSLSPLMRHKGVRLETTIVQDGAAVLAAGELEQVLTNLVVNALTHAFPDERSQSDPPVLKLECCVGEDVLCITLRDNGCGMPPEVVARVFEPFFTTRRSEGGSGLGMHIVHQIVRERFEGTIALETEAKQGTTWTLRLPFPTAALQLQQV